VLVEPLRAREPLLDPRLPPPAYPVPHPSQIRLPRRRRRRRNPGRAARSLASHPHCACATPSSP
jgi:hypothetical protein